jgi:glutamate-1-semialdehyde aminotransferase/acyl carrier protein
MAERLRDWARAHPGTPAPQVAAALARRRRHAHRGVIALRNLADIDPAAMTQAEAGTQAPLTFLFPGQGAQHAGRGQAVHATEPVFRSAFDECAERLAPDLGVNLRDVLFDPDRARATERLRDTALAQPAIFAVSYALAQQWAAWGIVADRMVGHSIGGFVAATLAGVFQLPDALRLIALRGRLMADLPRGTMLSVRTSESALATWLTDGVDLAAVNGAQACVLAGPEAAMARVAGALAAQGIVAKPLHTSHAFHSAMMDPALPAFQSALAKVALAAPTRPILSSVTGTWLRAEATDPAYWAAHMRRTVRFHDAVQRLWAEGRNVMLESGPGRTLATLAAQDPARRAVTLASLPHAEATGDANLHLRRSFGELWAHGQTVDFARLQPMDRRVSGLPSYPFQRKRHWVEPWKGEVAEAEALPTSPPTTGNDIPARLRAIMANLSGHAAADLPGGASFPALGFDSLMLTQAARDISQAFGVEVTLRALIDTQNSIDSLAADLETRAPKSRARPGAPQIAAAPAPAPLIQTRDIAALTDRQRAHIARLTARYTAKNAGSKALTAHYRPYHADPRTASGFNRHWKEMVYQIVTKGSKGSRLLDVDGNEYVDILNGFGPGFLGHGSQAVNDALIRQIDEGYEVGPQSLLAMEAAEMFCRLTGNDRASFVCTGSEAVAAAMRLARTFTGRDRIVLFARDFHGNFDEVLVRAGGSGTLPMAPGIPRSAVGHVTVLPYGTPEALEYIRENTGQLAAVMVEPVQSRRPEFRPADFIHEVRRLTQDNGALMIFDEVVTGFRFGLRGAQGYYGVQADLVTYGKVVGRGMPVGVVAGRAACMDTFDGGQWAYGDESFPQAPVTFFAGTFVRHPLALAALKAMLETLAAKPPLFWEAMNAKGDRLGRTMDRWFTENDMPFALPNCGSLLYLRIDDRAPLAPLIGPHLRDRGVFLLEGFPSYMTAAHDEAEIDHVIAAMQDAALEMRADGVIGGREDATPRAPRITKAPPRLSLPDGRAQIAQSMAAPLPPLYVPMTGAQREIWMALALNPGVVPAYNESVSLLLRGPLDRDAARAAVAFVLARHDALRATFPPDNGFGQVMQIAPSADFTVPFHDLTAGAGSAVAALLRAEVETPLPLETGPLVRAHLVAETPGIHRIVITAHHIVCDGWSIGVVPHEIAQAYAAILKGETPALPPAQSILAYARAEADWDTTPEAAAMRAHWRAVFADTPATLDLPTDMPRCADRARFGARCDLTLGADLAQRVRALARAQGVTLPAVLLSAWKLHLARLAGVSDITVGLPAAGQAARAMPGVVGHSVNLLPVRSRIDWQAGFVAHLAVKKRALIGTQDNQLLTFGTILRDLGMARDPGGIPLVPVLFNLDQGADLAAFALGETTATLQTNPRSHENFELSLNVAPLPDGDLVLELAYAADLFAPETAQAHLRGFIAVLEAACTAPDAPLRGIVATETPASWLAPGIGASAPLPQPETFWGLFAAQVARAPDASALIEGETRLAARWITCAFTCWMRSVARWRRGRQAGRHAFRRWGRAGNRIFQPA